MMSAETTRVLFSTLAQLFPVLVIALFADGIAKRSQHANDKYQIVMALVAAIFGESIALGTIVIADSLTEGAQTRSVIFTFLLLYSLAYVVVRPHFLEAWYGMFKNVRRSYTFAVSLIAGWVFLAGPLLLTTWQIESLLLRVLISLLVATVLLYLVLEVRKIRKHEDGGWSINKNGLSLRQWSKGTADDYAWMRQRYESPEAYALAKGKKSSLVEPNTPDEVVPSAGEKPDEPGVVSEETGDGGVGTGEDGAEEQAHEGNGDSNEQGEKKTLKHE